LYCNCFSAAKIDIAPSRHLHAMRDNVAYCHSPGAFLGRANCEFNGCRGFYSADPFASELPKQNSLVPSGQILPGMLIKDPCTARTGRSSGFSSSLADPLSCGLIDTRAEQRGGPLGGQYTAHAAFPACSTPGIRRLLGLRVSLCALARFWTSRERAATSDGSYGLRGGDSVGCCAILPSPGTLAIWPS